MEQIERDRAVSEKLGGEEMRGGKQCGPLSKAQIIEFENSTPPDSHVQRCRAFSGLAILPDDKERLESLHLTAAATSEEFQKQFQCLKYEFSRMHAEKEQIMPICRQGK